MKKTVSAITAAVLALLLVFSFSACGEKAESSGVWENALYLEDTELGSGAKTVTVEVRAEEKSVLFTIRTDKENLGDALIENKIVEGEAGPYGLYIKSVNGIVADYDVNQAYWSLSKNGEALLTGADGAAIADGDRYELTYTKE